MAHRDDWPPKPAAPKLSPEELAERRGLPGHRQQPLPAKPADSVEFVDDGRGARVKPQPFGSPYPHSNRRGR